MSDIINTLKTKEINKYEYNTIYKFIFDIDIDNNDLRTYLSLLLSELNIKIYRYSNTEYNRPFIDFNENTFSFYFPEDYDIDDIVFFIDNFLITTFMEYRDESVSDLKELLSMIITKILVHSKFIPDSDRTFNDKYRKLLERMSYILKHKIKSKGYINYGKELFNDIKSDILTDDLISKGYNILGDEFISYEKDLLKELEKADKYITESKDKLNRTLAKTRSEDNEYITEYLNNFIRKAKDPHYLFELAILELIDVDDNKSWKDINKIYYAALDILLPSKSKNINKLDTVVIFIDTSASVSNEELIDYINIILDIADTININRLVIVSHSYDITKVNIYETEDIMNINDDLLKIIGRGGTSHKRPYEEFEKKYNNILNDTSLLIFMSDFESDFESLYSEKLKKIDIPIILLSSSNNFKINLDDNKARLIYIK